MSTALVQSPAPNLLQTLARVRPQAALARTLLDELDRFVPPSARGSDVARFIALGDQLAEELERLGSQLSECAAAMHGISSESSAAE